VAASVIELPPTLAPVHWLPDVRRRVCDLDSSGTVDELDLVIWSERLGRCPDGRTGCTGDVNTDGIIDDDDLILLLQAIREQDWRPRDQSASSHVHKIGYVEPAPRGLVPAAFAAALPNGDRVTRLELHSQNAHGLRVQFSGLRGRTGIELRVYDPAGAAVFGPFSSPILDEDGTWWSPTIFGDRIGLELTLPAGSKFHEGQMPAIESLAYITCAGSCPPDLAGTPLECHVDVSCTSFDLAGVNDAVCKMIFVTGGFCTLCTGAMLNRLQADDCPLFMTANHCINTQSEANSLDVIWFFQTPECDGTPPDPNALPRNHGSLLLKRHSASDWTLLGLYEPAIAPVFFGFTTSSDFPTFLSAIGIHHPLGSFKRESHGNRTGNHDGFQFCDANGQNCFNADVWDLSFDFGTIEPGSSGSPIFLAHELLVRGTLTGGINGLICPPGVPAYYGRLDRAFTNLQYFLYNSDAAVVEVNPGLAGAGDPGNNGNAERGTFSNPFNSVHEATYCVDEGGVVYIEPGHYNEQMTIWRPMILFPGGEGSVVIGSP
jgi:hypothetical protein